MTEDFEVEGGSGSGSGDGSDGFGKNGAQTISKRDKSPGDGSGDDVPGLYKKDDDGDNGNEGNGEWSLGLLGVPREQREDYGWIKRKLTFSEENRSGDRPIPVVGGGSRNPNYEGALSKIKDAGSVVGKVKEAAAEVRSHIYHKSGDEGQEEAHEGKTIPRRDFLYALGAVGSGKAASDAMSGDKSPSDDGGAGTAPTPSPSPTPEGRETPTESQTPSDTPEEKDTPKGTPEDGTPTETPADGGTRNVYSDPSDAESFSSEQDMIEASPSYDSDLFKYEGEGEFIAGWEIGEVEEFWGTDLSSLEPYDANDNRLEDENDWLALDPDRNGDEFTLAWRGVEGNEVVVDASDVEEFADEYMPEETYTN